MRRVILRHSQPGQGPLPFAFGLADVLQALGSRALHADWRGANLLYTSSDDQAIESLERAGAGEFVTGAALVADQQRLTQLIDGDLEGFSGNERWVIVRAVDGTRWEVASDDPSVISAITKSFSVLDGAEMEVE